RAMLLRYLPLLMIYYAYGALGLVAIAEAFWIKEALTLSPAELAAIAVWLKGAVPPSASGAGRDRGVAHAALDHQDGVRAARRLGADLRLPAQGLRVHRRVPRRFGHGDSRLRSRWLDRVRKQERALRDSPASHRRRRRASGR